MRPGLAAALPPLLGAIAALACGAALLAGAGVELGRAAAAFLEGSLTSARGLAESAVAATPLAFAGLAVALAFRAGRFNVGAEGQLLAGMLAATAVGVRAPGLGAAGALALGAAAGAVTAGLAAWLRERRAVPEVLSTLLLNFVLAYAVSGAVHGALQEASGAQPQSDRIAAAVELPRLAAGLRLHAGSLLALAAAAALAFVLARTAYGLRLAAAGSSERAARTAGFPVSRDLALAFLGSGALAGLAGAVELTGVTRRLYEDPSPGYGYTAIAVALLARSRALPVLLSAAFFGALDAGTAALQREVGVARGFGLVLQAVALLAYLACDSERLLARWRSRAGAAGAGGGSA